MYKCCSGSGLAQPPASVWLGASFQSEKAIAQEPDPVRAPHAEAMSVELHSPRTGFIGSLSQAPDTLGCIASSPAVTTSDKATHCLLGPSEGLTTSREG